MWFVMEKVQVAYTLSEKLRRIIVDDNISNGSASASADPTESSKLPAITALIKEGVDVNQPCGNYLPLHSACVKGDMNVIRILVENEAQVNVVDGFGRAALHYAAERSVESAAYLLSQGAVVNIRDRNGNTPLHWAAYKNRHDCVRFLLEHHADPDAEDHNFDTPLSCAALKGNLECIRILLAFNCNVDTRNLSGSSPVSRLLQTIAIGIGSVQEEECLQLLLKAVGQFELRNPATGLLPDVLERDADIRERVLLYCCNVRSLQELSRHRIRRALGACQLASVLPLLPLPTNLQEFVLLQS